jgi:hypothetical protein
LLHHRRQVEAERLELLQEIENHRRTRFRETAEPRVAVRRAVALIDHHQLVDVPERRGDGAEDSR